MKLQRGYILVVVSSSIYFEKRETFFSRNGSYVFGEDSFTAVSEFELLKCKTEQPFLKRINYVRTTVSSNCIFFSFEQKGVKKGPISKALESIEWGTKLDYSYLPEFRVGLIHSKILSLIFETLDKNCTISWIEVITKLCWLVTPKKRKKMKAGLMAERW